MTMRSSARAVARGGLALTVTIALGCAAHPPDAPAAGSGSQDDDGSAGSGGSISITSGSGGGGATAPGLVAEVFGESADVLYRLDPETKQLAEVGPFQGCTGVTDIALDHASALFGTTDGGLFRIDKSTAECTPISSGEYPNSLSFVPAGTVDAGGEALVGYLEATYVRIDTSTGVVTSIGELAGGYASSGDIVSVKDGPTLLTVTGPDCVADCIVAVDPQTGALIENHGELPYAGVYGLAFWAGAAYGFSEDGELFEVGFAGGALQTTPIAIADAPSGLSFWGAGSTTSAPPEAVPE